FGGAQVASAELQYVLQDVSSVFQGANLQSEALAALRFSWPTFAKIEGLRLGAQLSATYSFRLLIDPFRLESFTLGARLPVNLFSYTYFNGFDLNVSVERQIPRNFATALDDALDQAQSEEEIAYILSTFSQFEVLDAYLRETGDFFTGVYTGVNLRGEHRDNPVNPRSGTFASISTEFGWGAGKFVRLQFFNSVITPVNPTLVLATKVKVGHIQLLDFQRGSATDTNTYVPLERQFFAGGAASIRSFASRTLHDPSSGYIDIDDALSQSRLSNVIGSGSLVELGFEARFTFSRPRNLDDLWATMIERSGITLFTDIGNSFNRLTEDLYGKMRLQDLWQGSVVAAGIGYRFDTPVGPFRIDYATSIYDPTRSAGQVIWNGRENVFGFNNWLLSIGLGHAF
ncbi:MAG: BamA/TamA family outer membrane protein, partial [Candidatus Kapaibacteriota bacterium]